MHAYNCLFAERFYLRKNIAVLFSVSEGKFFFRYCSEKRESKEMNKKKERKKRKDKQIHLISSFLCVCVFIYILQRYGLHNFRQPGQRAEKI